MSQEIQIQKKNTNLFRYCNFVARDGKIIVETETMQYDSETEQNEILYKEEYNIENFCEFLKDKTWIIC